MIQKFNHQTPQSIVRSNKSCYNIRHWWEMRVIRHAVKLVKWVEITKAIHSSHNLLINPSSFSQMIIKPTINYVKIVVVI